MQGGVGNFEAVEKDMKEFQRTGQVPKSCKAKEALPSEHRLLQEAGNTMVVKGPDGHEANLRQVLLREFPWMERVWQNRMVADDASGKDLFKAASQEWERLQLYGKYVLAAKQQEQARQAFGPNSLLGDLLGHLDKLLEAVAQLTGETVDSLRPKYRAEKEELQAFASTVQKVLATRAAAARMRETKQAEKVKAKHEEAKTKVDAMDLNQVVAASVTQSLLQVLPSCGVKVPKKLQDNMAAAATRPIAESAVKEKVLNDLLANCQRRKKRRQRQGER